MFLLILVYTTSFSQGTYWQQETNFTITVSLNDASHSLDGFESIEYINHSPDTLKFIWFHLWPNAYKNDRTAFSEQLLKNGRTDFYFSKPEDKGYINRLDFKADGVKAEMENTIQIDVVRLLLPAPLAPGKKTIISTPFHVQLPSYFSRGGHVGQDYQVTQWYPKPAVYDAKGWHPMPYLDQGEFYNELGNYDVQVTLPSAYTVAATGVLQDEKMLTELKEKGTISSIKGAQTWHYKQNNVHDFAWFAAKGIVAKYDTARLPSGKIVEVFSYYKKGNDAWRKSVEYVKDGIRYYSSLSGDYPYSTASVVQGPENITSGGMEYPTIALITTNESGRELDKTIVHEVGHNWFYGALASNERQHPWMDEGMNSYYAQRYETMKYGSRSALQMTMNKWANKLPADEEKLILATMEKLEKGQPISTPSDSLSEINYGLSVYVKGAEWMKQLEQKVGTPAFDKAMQDYYAAWKNKHPSPEDFKRSLEQSLSQSFDEQFRQLHATAPLNTTPKQRTLKPTFLFNLRDTDKYNYINFTPAFGYNKYDKVMLGLLVHNYQLPLNKFNFVASGLYATGSGKFNTFSRASYNITHKTYDVETALSVMNFTMDDFTPDTGNTLYQRVRRIVPSIKLTLYNKNDPFYSKRLTLQWKTFLLKEDQLDFRTEINGTDTMDVVDLNADNTTINRLSLTYSDSRVLYPYSINLLADQNKDFIRAGLTANYFFNYSDNKSGLKARFFAGKFFYLKNRNTYLNRYTLNMSGPKGDEDYTYSNYFVGRNEFEGFMSQQIMERDGFFKVRTDLLGDKIGKTDDWLMSLNLVTDLPDNINPLRVLPIKVPLKIFADIGTYAEAWKENPATGRFLYDAGLQVPLFRSLLNVYIPILYSKVYSNYFKSTITEKRFLKNISFSIDIQRIYNVLSGNQTQWLPVTPTSL
jgi:hypothetical protein